MLGDGLAGLRALPDGSVDMILTDPPSGATKRKTDLAPNLPALFEAMGHALKPNGVAVVMASSLVFAGEVHRHGGTWFRHDYIWTKSTVTGFLNAKIAPLRRHEFVLVFGRHPMTYHPQKTTGHPPQRASTMRGSSGDNYGTTNGKAGGKGGVTTRFPTSVLTMSSLGVRHPERRHPQQKPRELGDFFVRTYSNEGDLVADPFAGSGAFGEAALGNGRRFVGWDSDPAFGMVGK